MKEKKELNKRTGRFNIQRKVPERSAPKIFYPIAFFILINIMWVNNMQAQKFYVQQKNGVQNEFALEGISRLTFPSGNIEILHTNGSTTDFNTENLRYLAFVDFTTDAPGNVVPEMLDITVHPNPAGNVLHVNYKMDKHGLFCFKIINLQGQILALKETAGQAGMNNIDFNLENFPGGMYFLKAQFQQKTITTKFFKQ